MPAPTIFTNATILFGENLISAEMNEVRMELQAEPKDSTNLASDGWREYTPGLVTAKFDIKGFHAATLDPSFFTAIGGTAVPLTITKTLPVAAGDISYSQLVLEGQYQQGNTVAELASCSLMYSGTAALLRGKCIQSVTAATASGNGAGLNHGAALSTQKVYAVLHVRALTGTLDLALESDADNTWASALIRVTFDQMTTTGWQVKELAGPVTDTWWRVARTIAGGTPTATYDVFLIIQ